MHAQRASRKVLLVLALVVSATATTADRASARGERESTEQRDLGRGHEDGHHGRRAGGTCTTTFQFTGPSTIHIAGLCNLAHLGAATLSAEQSVVQNADGSVGAVNDSVYTAANGDQLFSHFVGSAVPTATGLALSGVETYTGGTGRFDDAEGRSSLIGTVTFTSATGGIGQYSIAGRIRF